MTNGYTGARHKGFSTLEEAEDWLAKNRSLLTREDIVSQPLGIPKSEPVRQTMDDLPLAE